MTPYALRMGCEDEIVRLDSHHPLGSHTPSAYYKGCTVALIYYVHLL